MNPEFVQEHAQEYRNIECLGFHVESKNWLYLTKWAPPIDTTAWLPQMYPSVDVRGSYMFLAALSAPGARNRFVAEIHAPRMETIDLMHDDELFDPAYSCIARRVGGFGDISFRLIQKSKFKKRDGFYESPEWQELRYRALEFHGAKCAACGRTAKNQVILHVDHIKPRSRYPELELDFSNIQVLCHECNLGKSNHYTTDWR
jgi:hypothetical protein